MSRTVVLRTTMELDGEAVICELRGRFARAGNAARAAGMQAYMKSEMPFHGVPVPEVRRLAGPVISALEFGSASEWRATVRDLWDRSRYREERYAVITLARSRVSRAYQTVSALSLYGRLIRSGAWWDLVDELAINCVGPIVRAYPAAARPTVLRWSRGSDLWKRRAAIICQVGSGRTTDATLLARCIGPSLDSPEFFLRKGIGWALRQYARVEPSWVARFVRTHRGRLSPLSRREALRHLGPKGTPSTRRRRPKQD